MTCSIHIDISDTVLSISLVMPSNFNKDNVPLLNNADVTIKTTPDEYVAAIKFSGFASSDNLKKDAKMLESFTKAYHFPYCQHFRYLGYNPP